ncbi:MAG TPA: CehA/McbA family metallohydrolase [Caldilineae bacterium]|nr:CehA/McbA family metallohydrolase [Caldilineae bacterium]
MPTTTIFNPTPGWYAGDFHAHTHFSDGALSPDELVALAQAEGLDFLAITDHNDIGALSAFAAPPPMPIVRGIEITLKIGHFNVFGVDAWPDWLDAMLPGETWQERVQGQPDINRMMALCQAEGWLVSINHPLLTPWEWQNEDTLLDHLDALEIWNDPTWGDNAWANPDAVAYWTRLLNAGYRITAIGGTDFHFTNPEPGPYQPRLNLPRTYVYAEQLSTAAILDAVRKRRAYMTMGPTLRFQAAMQGVSYGMGDDLGAVTGELALTAEAVLEQGEGRILLLKNGEIIADGRSRDGRIAVQWQSELNPREPAWFRCDVLDAEGRFLTVSNPIFTGPHHPPAPHTFGEFLADA